MNRKILLIFVALMALAILATPVFAIGPWGGAEANDNANLVPLGLAVNNFRGDGNPLGFNSWIVGNTGNWIEWKIRDARYSKGLMNNALVPTLAQITPSFMGGEANQNKWMYLTPDSAPGAHDGTLWLFIRGATGSAAYANAIAAGFTGGAFYMYNIVLPVK